MDGGYGFRNRVAALQQAPTDAVVRIYPPTFPLETADGRPLDVRSWLDDLRGSQGSRVATYQHDGRRFPVRLLAYRLPEPQRQAAQRKATTRARKRQRPLQTITAYFADWVILVTTLRDTETWPDAAIWRLYRTRWQVELLFKRMKPLLAIGQLRGRTLASGVPLVWALLVIWVLHEPHLTRLRRDLSALARPHPATLPGQFPDAEAVVRTWGASRLLLETLLHAIRGTWSLARVQACVPRLQRYLVMHPRSDRVHQATEVSAWLSGVRRTRRAPLPDAA
ncbi:MAG: transposase [Blastochloris sp.]|nr:transposase [Blastochloris sp.]